jgi:hypothetical protein
VEIPPGAISGGDPSMAVTTESNEERTPAPAAPEPELEPELEIDEDFLRRIREV